MIYVFFAVMAFAGHAGLAFVVCLMLLLAGGSSSATEREVKGITPSKKTDAHIKGYLTSGQ